MGKQNITISIDHEIVHKLRQGGGISQTINTLLEKSLFGENTKEGIQKLINEKNEEVKKLESDIALLREKLAEKPKLIVRQT